MLTITDNFLLVEKYTYLVEHGEAICPAVRHNMQPGQIAIDTENNRCFTIVDKTGEGDLVWMEC